MEMPSTRPVVGAIGVLAPHEPVLARLEPTELRLYRSESEVVRYAQAEGYLQFAENHALVLVEEAVRPEDLDRGLLEEKLSEARAAAERAPEDSEERARALREVARCEAFLAVGN